MSPNPAQYGSGIVSSRSRRLRTVAAVLLFAIIAMAIFGMRVLVPDVNRAANAAVKPGIHAEAASVQAGANPTFSGPLKLTKKQAQMLRLDVLFEAGYWIFWIVLIVSLLLVTWMDLREVSRTYLNQRRDLWAVAARASTGDPSQTSNGPEAGPNNLKNAERNSDPPAHPG